MSAASVEIKGFLETSFVDWPGKVASVVFLPGCNFRCPYCHNHRLVTDPQGFRTWPQDEVLGRLERLRDWVDGVCVTGGEPTLHPGLPAFLRTLRDHRWAVKLDTNGSRPEVVREVLRDGLAAAFSVDVKAPLEPIPYRRNAGQGSDPGRVRETLSLLAAAGVPVELRTTVHPKLLALGELRRLAGQIGELFGAAATWKLQRCRVEDTLDSSLRDEGPADPELFFSWERELLRREAS